MADGKVTIETVLDSKEFNKALGNLGKTTKTGLSVATKAIAATASAVGGLAGVAIRSGIKFESAFAGVKKTVDATDEELAKFKQSIRDMSKEMPSSAEAIAGVAEAAGQLGIKNENLIGFTRTMTMLGDATNMSSDEAATSLARLANITGMSQSNFDRLGSTVVALGNNLATTESEIVAMSMRIAGAGHQVGMTEAQIMSFSGALSSVGIEAEAGGTAFSSLISKMSLATQKGGEQLEQFAKVAGMSASEFKTAFERDAANAIITFIKGLDKINKNGGSAIKTLDEMGLSDIRMRDALLRAAGASDTFSEALAIGNRAWDENKALTKEAEQRYKTLESRIQIFKNTINDIGISLYESVNTPLGDMVTSATNAANGLEKAFQKDGITGLAKGIGEVFADAATAVTAQAPTLISAGAKTVKAFVQGLYANRKEIIRAGGDMAIALAGGIGDMLPKGLGNTLKNLTAATVAVVKPMLRLADILLKVAAAGSNVAPVILGVVGAMKAYNKVTRVVRDFRIAEEALGRAMAVSMVFYKQSLFISKSLSVAKTFAAAKNKVLAASTTALSVTTGKNSVAVAANTAIVEAHSIAAGVAAVATKGFGVAMTLLGGPVGVAIAGIGALVGVIALIGRDSETAAEKHAKATAKLVNSINKQRDAYNETIKAAKNKMNSDVMEMDIAAGLKQELDSLVDANGRVKKGYEARAAVIADELSKATGIELSLVDGEIKGYGELGSAIDTYIEKKRAEAIVKANEEAWIANQKQIREEIKHYQELSDEYDYAAKKYQESIEKGSNASGHWLAEMQRIDEQREKSSNTIKKCNQQDMEYQQLYADFLAGNYAVVNACVEGHGAKMAEIEGMKRSELEKTKTKTENDLHVLEDLYKKTGDKQVGHARDAKQKELALIDEKLAGMTSKTRSGGDKVASEAGKASDKALSAAGRNKGSWHGLGSSMMSGLRNGIISGARSIANAAVSAVKNAYSKARAHLHINSPSKLFRDGVGKPIPEGIAVGVEEDANLISEATVGALDLAYDKAKQNTGLSEALRNMDIPEVAAKFKSAAEVQMSIVPSAVSSFNKAKYEDYKATEEPVEIHVHTHIGPREVAETTALYNDREQGKLAKRRERGNAE